MKWSDFFSFLIFVIELFKVFLAALRIVIKLCGLNKKKSNRPRKR